MIRHPDIAAIAIGRNEGDRLIACLDALLGRVGQIVYVDSGSNDGSCEAARARGIHVVELDMSIPFTAARARNAGLAHLMASDTPPRYVQVLDGDCILQPGWLATAWAFLEETPRAAIACGRRREISPASSPYNMLIDREWDTPVGQALACGGDALIRVDALQEVGGYDPNLIAGEEPELCIRLRQAGWEIWRLDAEMTLHDAAITRFGQWWQRARRAGFAYASLARLHGASPERAGWHNLKHIIAWGIVLPLLTVLGLFATPLALGLLLAYPAQILRRLLRGDDWHDAVYITLAKLPEAQGVLTFVWRTLMGRKAALIEYK